MDSAFSFQGRPRLLKDFLVDDSPSCSSNDLFSKWDGNSPRLLRNRSKAAFAVHKASDMVMNAMKLVPFASIIIKSPSILPRSISRKLSRKKKDGNHVNHHLVLGDASVYKVKIKDILRWKSFRDVAMEEMAPAPLHFSCSPNHCSGFDNSASTGSRSSWCDVCDLSSEDSSSSSWCYSEGDKKCQLEENVPGDCVGLEGTTKSKHWQRLQVEENDQHSPVSVLESPFREDEDEQSFSVFHRSLATMERRKCILMLRIQKFESLTKLENVTHDLEKESRGANSIFEEEEEKNNDAMEQKAKKLLSRVKETSSGKELEANAECLLLDFFRQELCVSTKQNDAEFDREMLRLAESWMNIKGRNGSLDWEMLRKRKNSIRDMEKGLRWNKFEEEQQEIGCDLEIAVLNDLFDELLADLTQIKTSACCCEVV